MEDILLPDRRHRHAMSSTTGALGKGEVIYLRLA